MSLSPKRPEQRQFGRRQTQYHAWIEVPGRPRFPCIVRNISEGGALLEFDAPTWLPYRFHLSVPPAGVASWCEVRHQGRASVGVRFIDAPPAPAPEANSRVDRRSVDDKAAWSGE